MDYNLPLTTPSPGTCRTRLLNVARLDCESCGQFGEGRHFDYIYHSHLPGGKINAPGAMLRTRAPVALLEPARGGEASGRKKTVKLARTKRCTATDGA